MISRERRSAVKISFYMASSINDISKSTRSLLNTCNMYHLHPENGRQVKTDLPWEENGEMCFRQGGLIGMQLKIFKKLAYNAKQLALTKRHCKSVHIYYA